MYQYTYTLSMTISVMTNKQLAKGQEVPVLA